MTARQSPPGERISMGGMFTIVNIVVGAAFAALLFYAAYKDIKTLCVSNLVCISICALAVVRILKGSITPLSAVSGLIFAALPFFIMTLLKFGSVGGGDIKLLGSIGLFLGIDGAVFVVAAACVSFLAVQFCRKVVLRSTVKRAAFVPYIAGAAVMFHVSDILLPAIQTYINGVIK